MLRQDKRIVSELKPSRRNSKRHPEKQINLLMQSLREFGWTMPVLVDEAGEIIAGHGIFEAARRLHRQKTTIPGWDDPGMVPVVINDRLTPEQRRAYRIADNRLAELGVWDEDALAEELRALEDAGATLLTTGFSDEEVAKYIAQAGEAEDDDEPAPEIPITPELYEAHNYLVLYFDDELSWRAAVETFGLHTVQTPDSRPGYVRKGLGRVIEGAQVLEMIR